jgi:hypothetical protein
MDDREPMPEPLDPFPDLAMLDVPEHTVMDPTTGQTQVFPPCTIAIRILARDADGIPILVQPA